MTPTARTLAHLRRAGYLADVAERWIAAARIRRDLFGVIDLIAIAAGKPILGVQATTLANISARLAKARGSAALGVWLATGSRFQVFGWAKRNGRWFPRIVEVKPGDLAPIVQAEPPRAKRKPRHCPADLFAEI